MKAIVLHAFGGPEVLRYEDFPDPVAGPGELVIAVQAVSVNRTLDIVLRTGKYSKPVKFPHIIGVDPSGVVASVGEGVTNRKVGDRVTALPWRVQPVGPLDSVGVQHQGGYAQLVKIPAHATTIVLDGVDFATATVVTRHAPAAFNLLRDRANVQPGEFVLVMGASGGLGSACVQVAKALGAKVIAGAGADERVAAAMRLGADYGVNYRTQDLEAEVMKISGGAGIQVVAENIADPVLFPKAMNCLARHGRLVTSGSHGGGKVELDVTRLYLYQIAVMGTLGFKPADVDASLAAAAQGKFKVLINRIFPLREAAAAQSLVESRDGLGKVILDPTLA